MHGIIAELQKVRCDACSGYGHASSSCPTYARFVEVGAGNKPFQKMFRATLEIVAGKRKEKARDPAAME